MQTGARICPRCATRVDERQARGSPVCLRCGAPLGTGPVPAVAKGAKSGSALPWILGGVAIVALLGTCGTGGTLGAPPRDRPPTPTAPPGTNTGAPNFESTASATASGKPPPKPTVPAPPTVVATPVRPTATPTPIVVPPPPPTVTAPPTNTGTQTLGAFPRQQALNELDRVTAGLQSCHKAGDPSGQGSIRVDFEPDGRTGTLHRPPFSQTTMGSCISARFLAIKMGKFDGTTQRIERTYTINP